MNNEEIAEIVTEELHRFKLLKDEEENTKICVKNHILTLLDLEERKLLEKLFTKRENIRLVRKDEK